MTHQTLRVEVRGGDTGAPLNLKKRIALLQKYVDIKGKRVLDCGCGKGEYVRALASSGADAWGVEYNAEKVAYFRRNYPGSDRVQVGDIEQLNIPTGSFDVVLLNEVLEHIPDDRRALLETNRVLKPGGALVVFSPNRLYPLESHGVYLKGSGRRLPYYTPFISYIPLRLGVKIFRYWARNYWPGELRRLVRESGFDVITTDYVWQTFENISKHQPALATSLRPILRTLFRILEQVPVVRSFGISQVVVARKL